MRPRLAQSASAPASGMRKVAVARSRSPTNLLVRQPGKDNVAGGSGFRWLSPPGKRRRCVDEQRQLDAARPPPSDQMVAGRGGDSPQKLKTGLLHPSGDGILATAERIPWLNAADGAPPVL